MDFQVVVLAGGSSKNLAPLVSNVISPPSLSSSATPIQLTPPPLQEVPKPLLPVANRPVLSYVLELLEASNLKDLIVVRPPLSLFYQLEF